MDNAFHRMRVAHASHSAGHAASTKFAVTIPPSSPRGGGHAAGGRFLNDFLYPNPSPYYARWMREFACTFFMMFFGFMILCNPMTDYIWSPAVAFATSHYIIYEVFYGTAANPMLSFLNWVYNTEGERPWYHWAAMVAQFGGAMTAAAVTNSLVADFRFARNIPWTPMEDGQVFGVEFLICFGYSWLHHLIYRTGIDGKETYVSSDFRGIVLGTYWLLAHACTNASLNIFRTLAPAIVTGQYSKVFYYILGDFLGYITAAIVFVLAYGQKRS
jgi:glycerol uptake facilitator-like aquaporin